MTIINQTKYLEFKSTTSPSGSLWYYIKRTNDSNNHDSAVAITTVVKKGDGYSFLFLKTKRPPILAELKADYCLESPAGLIGDDDKEENLIKCAKKELLEETGYYSDKIFIELKNSSTSAGLTSETLTYVTAIVENDKIISKPISDGGIIVDRIYVPINDIYTYLYSIDSTKVSISSAMICGIFYALNRINSLQLQ